MRRHLKVVRGGEAIRDDVRDWIHARRDELKRMTLAAIGTGDMHTAEQLMRCRDALARLEFEFEHVDPYDADGGA